MTALLTFDASHCLLQVPADLMAEVEAAAKASQTADMCALRFLCLDFPIRDPEIVFAASRDDT